MAIRAGERKTQILDTLAHMLEQPHAARITTAALAARMHVSEAALYRHFASKAQMFEGLIGSIEVTLIAKILSVTSSHTSGLLQARQLVTLLLNFAQENRGMTRVLTGDALVTEDNRLLDRINTLIIQIESALHQTLRNAVVDGGLPAGADSQAYANVLTHFILGKWLRFAQSGWRATPTDDLDAHFAWLIPSTA